MALENPDVKSINKKNRTIELMDGRTVPLPDDLAFEFFGSKAAKEKKTGYKEAVGETHKLLSNIPGGQYAVPYTSGHMDTDFFARLGDSALDYLTEIPSSLSTGEGQENLSYFERLGENLIAKKKGKQEGSSEIASQYPKTRIAGQVGGFGSSLVAPLPTNMAAQGAIMGLGLSDKDLINDPMGLAKDVAIDTAVGYGVGKVGTQLERVASERAALRNHPELLAQHAAAQTKDQKRFIAEMARKIDAIDTELRAGIPKGSLLMDEFINDSINLSPMAGTPEGNNLSNFFKAIGDAVPENFNSYELKKIFTTIEERMATATPQEAGIFNAFREHLVKNIPIGAAGNGVKSKFGSRIFGGFEKEVDKAVSKLTSDKNFMEAIKKHVGKDVAQGLDKDLKQIIKSSYEKMSPVEFMEELKNGQLHDKMMGYFNNNPKLVKIEKGIQDVVTNMQQHVNIANLRNKSEITALFQIPKEIEMVRQKLSNSLKKSISDNLTSAHVYEKDIINKVSSKLSNAVGVKNPFTTGTPTNARPIATPPPVAPQTGKLAQFFEQPGFYKNNLQKLLSFKGTGGMAKLGYLFKGLPKAGVAGALGAGAAGLTSALRGITSPTAMGAFARKGIQEGGLRLIVESIADKYPSYQDGILSDPKERRSATAEIEQDPDIGLEDKAVLQARINRGQSIIGLIKE